MKHAFTLTAVSLLSSHIAYANPNHESNIEVKATCSLNSATTIKVAISNLLSRYFEQRRCGAPEQGVQLMHGELGLLAIWPQVLAEKSSSVATTERMSRSKRSGYNLISDKTGPYV